jgi:pyrroline-5-carboxylate reductase
MQDVFHPNVTLAVDSDAAVNQATVISGCGPAFFAWFATQLRSVADSALTEAQTTALITTTMVGTARMLNWIPVDQEPSPAERIIKMVASPGGVTEAGLNRLDSAKIDVEMRDTFAHANERIHTLCHTIDPASTDTCEICGGRKVLDESIHAMHAQ